MMVTMMMMSGDCQCLRVHILIFQIGHWLSANNLFEIDYIIKLCIAVIYIALYCLE